MKNKIEIKNRWTDEVIFEYEDENNTIKKAVEEAVKVGTDLRGANLRGAYLRGAYLRGVDLREADLREADLREADLEGAYLRGVDLREADLEGAYLRGVDLREAYLREADLEGAYLEGANLEGAYLRGANLRGVYLYVSDEEIDNAKIISNFEQMASIKIKEFYINHDIYPTKWNDFWKNGLIIRDWEKVDTEFEEIEEINNDYYDEINKCIGGKKEISNGEIVDKINQLIINQKKLIDEVNKLKRSDD